MSERNGPAAGRRAGSKRSFRLRGRDVVAVAQPQAIPAARSPYLASGDADATAAVIQEAGGTAVLEPVDVMDAGCMLVAQDSSGP